MPSRCALMFVTLFAAASVVGCGGGEGVKSYHAPRIAQPTAKENVGPFRLLGVMVPANDPVWFFKLSGRTDDISKYEEGFDQLVKSIQDKGAKTPPAFAAPEGWKLGGARAGFVRVEQTVKLPDSTLEVTLVKSGGGVGQNLDRWVGMLGHAARPGDEERFTKTVAAAGGPVLRVDIRGHKDPNKSAGPMMGKR